MKNVEEFHIVYKGNNLKLTCNDDKISHDGQILNDELMWYFQKDTEEHEPLENPPWAILSGNEVEIKNIDATNEKFNLICKRSYHFGVLETTTYTIEYMGKLFLDF